MIKDIILNLERDKSRDSVRDYAISIAEAFDSHIAGVAFADGSGIPGFLTPDFRPKFSWVSAPSRKRQHARRRAF